MYTNIRKNSFDRGLNSFDHKNAGDGMISLGDLGWLGHLFLGYFENFKFLSQFFEKNLSF